MARMVRLELLVQVAVLPRQPCVMLLEPALVAAVAAPVAAEEEAPVARSF